MKEHNSSPPPLACARKEKQQDLEHTHQPQ
jgi:hypothetical protein